MELKKMREMTDVELNAELEKMKKNCSISDSSMLQDSLRTL